MNIKRRLIVSNILMLLIPLVVTLVVFFGGLHVYATIAGLREDREDRRRDARVFFKAREQAQSLAEKWRKNVDIASIMCDVDMFNEQYKDGEQKNGGPVLLVYKNGTKLTPQDVPDDSFLVEQALSQESPLTILGAVHVQKVGDYHVLLHDAYRVIRAFRSYKDVMFEGTVVSLICSVFIILLTNHFLTRFVFGKIVYALDTLTHGVHQIRDGNLSFRIDYGGKDEFTVVCEDFNEMAARLLDSVIAGQKDEQSRRELIAGISHDLRTPLTSIKAYVEGIEKGLATTPNTYRRYIETIKNKTDDLEHIIEMLFLFSKLDTGELPYHIERVDLASVVSEVVENLSEEYESRGLDISLSRGTEKVWVDIDVMQMRCVMINIFENSSKYRNKERGKMSVVVSEAGVACAGTACSGGNAVVTFTDDGPGVPEGALSKLFDVFYRSDPSRNNPSKGSGLGLAIAAKIVDHFGGTIEAANEPGGGLSIIMRFPKREGGENSS
ncbi:MAG: HAMP domain-containing histidine kinase [Synergistaceae bacterium]|jgi:signal transduction histidine kinase|nr:HAMP domain-containing histidine kinase [Synergistaceae bacterium]